MKTYKSLNFISNQEDESAEQLRRVLCTTFNEGNLIAVRKFAMRSDEVLASYFDVGRQHVGNLSLLMGYDGFWG